MVDSNESRAIACVASGNITVTKLTADHGFGHNSTTAQEASGKRHILLIYHTFIHPVIHQHSCYYLKNT